MTYVAHKCSVTPPSKKNKTKRKTYVDLRKVNEKKGIIDIKDLHLNENLTDTVNFKWLILKSARAFLTLFVPGVSRSAHPYGKLPGV